MRGRRAVPVILQQIRGNRGKRKTRPEPEYSVGLGEPPEYLSEIARGEWVRLARELEGAEVVRATDRNALAGYCTIYARWREAEEWIRANGTIAVLRSDKGAVVKLMLAPQVTVAFQALRELRALAAEFGFTPATRGKVQAGRSKSPEDRFAAHKR